MLEPFGVSLDDFRTAVGGAAVADDVFAFHARLLLEHAAHGLGEIARLLVGGRDDRELRPVGCRARRGENLGPEFAGGIGHVRRHLEEHQLGPFPAAEPQRQELPLDAHSALEDGLP